MSKRRHNKLGEVMEKIHRAYPAFCCLAWKWGWMGNESCNGRGPPCNKWDSLGNLFVNTIKKLVVVVWESYSLRSLESVGSSYFVLSASISLFQGWFAMPPTTDIAGMDICRSGNELLLIMFIGWNTSRAGKKRSFWHEKLQTLYFYPPEALCDGCWMDGVKTTSL